MRTTGSQSEGPLTPKPKPNQAYGCLLVEVDHRLAVGVGAELALVVDLRTQLLVVVDLTVDGERQLAVLAWGEAQAQAQAQSSGAGAGLGAPPGQGVGPGCRERARAALR